MTRYNSALTSLCECLQGRLPARVDWLSLIALANQTLTSPALIDLVDDFGSQIPEDVCAYVRHIHQCNLARNDRLTVQLEEAVAAINEHGVIPVLLKGAAMLATALPPRRGARLMVDLDILVEPRRIETALNALAGLGYELYSQSTAELEKWFAELKRPQDVGMIDLHRSPPGPAYFYHPMGDVLQHCRLVSFGRGYAYIPTATYQALILIIHDEFQDRDYWVGQLDLRHLHELRRLTNSPEGVDWEQLASFAKSKLARNALETQLVALAQLLAVDVPHHMCKRLIPRLQFARRLMQARFPATRWPLLLAATLDYTNYRRGPGAESRRPGRILRRLRVITDITSNLRTGKV